MLDEYFFEILIDANIPINTPKGVFFQVDGKPIFTYY